VEMLKGKHHVAQHLHAIHLPKSLVMDHNQYKPMYYISILMWACIILPIKNAQNQWLVSGVPINSYLIIK
jgi:hypothetical protein